MRRFKLIVEYDGTRYSGWQLQKAAPTIQSELTRAASKITNEPITIEGASRTDAGVHAIGQVAAFSTGSPIATGNLHRGLNALLASDIAVREMSEVSPEFDPRRDAKEKTYLYRVLNRPVKSALHEKRAWFVHWPLDLERMREAAGFMLGERDFSSFRAADSDSPHSIREIRSIDVEREGDFIDITVRGRAFLRHMVRIMAGTLVTVGEGRLEPGEVEAIIEARDRRAAPLTAPPWGLYLTKILY
jgi:tRNA pseudouridine38-40 synthase